MLLIKLWHIFNFWSLPFHQNRRLIRLVSEVRRVRHYLNRTVVVLLKLSGLKHGVSALLLLLVDDR